MKLLQITRIVVSLLFTCNTYAQVSQGFFLNDWKPRTIESPQFIDAPQTTDPVTVSVKVRFNDTLSKIPDYIFGDNANLYTGCMSDNPALMKHISDRHLGVLRGPSGSISDIFFWNRSVNQRPDDIPATLAGQTTAFEPWYGVRPYSWENWTMAVDSFYKVLDQVNATGMLTVNYGYARYGTSSNPVARAAHMAADWVRYDNGRTKFWEIGNEVNGSWEAGYRIDPSLNKDGQPEYITGTLYGQHCRVFIDSMKTAALSLGLDIKIGVVMCEENTPANTAWNTDVANHAGDVADFYVVHSYFTPYNQNSSVEVILNSPRKTAGFKNYVWSLLDAIGKPRKPVALTEFNIFAQGSMQAVSHANGIHGVMVTGEAIKSGYGAALRWDLANGWGTTGDDHGMFSYGSEPGIDTYEPRPAFYHMYYFRKYLGDVLLQSTIRGDTNVSVYPSAFSSGQAAAVVINKGKQKEIIRLNIRDFKFGNRYYTYTLTGGTDNGDFSRKVFVNDEGNSLVAGGPGNYETIQARSSLIADEIRIELPPLSVTHVLVEPGDKELTINEDIWGKNDIELNDYIRISPNPSKGRFSILSIPDGIESLEISDISGKIIHTDKVTGNSCLVNITAGKLVPGVYIISLRGNGKILVKKLVIQ